MDEALSVVVKEAVYRSTGVEVVVSVSKTPSGRSCLIAHPTGFSSQEGPRFTIQSWAIKRYLVSAEMGNYALQCIKTMQQASAEQVALARAFVAELNENGDFIVSIGPNQSVADWTVTDRDFKISVEIRALSDQAEVDRIANIATRVVAPLLSALGELIGYEETAERSWELAEPALAQLGEHEGELTIATVIRRERSRRNRQLCLTIHGDLCSVCGLVPESAYPGVPSIIEVHHIETLAGISAPKVYNPRTDLIPLCPNCHRAIHKRNPSYLPSELKGALRKTP
jgi:5-methylcytosine-specific restriction enzyme A